MHSKGQLGFNALNADGIGYAGLGGFDKLLDDRSRDIDLVVSPRDLCRTVDCLSKSYRDGGWTFIKLIVNEYAVQIFFSKTEGNRCRFLQWDIMPCLTWRGLKIVEVSSLIESSRMNEGVSVAPLPLVKIYKEYRTALCNSTHQVLLENDILQSATGSNTAPIWLQDVIGFQGSRLRRAFYQKRILVDIRAHFRFYRLNIRRLLNPPGLVIATTSDLCETWSQCFERATAEEEAFPYTGIIVLREDSLSLRARVRLVRELYLGRVIVVHLGDGSPGQGVGFGSRSLNFLFFGSVDGVVEEGISKRSKHETLIQGLIDITKRIFIKK